MGMPKAEIAVMTKKLSQINRKTRHGEVPEWLKGADCKSAASGFEGSNPSLTTILSRGGAAGSSSGS